MSRSGPKKLPPADDDPFYGSRYSIPVWVMGYSGVVTRCAVRYCFHMNGWVEDGLSEGPDPDDYPRLKDPKYKPVRWVPVDKLAAVLVHWGTEI